MEAPLRRADILESGNHFIVIIRPPFAVQGQQARDAWLGRQGVILGYDEARLGAADLGADVGDVGVECLAIGVVVGVSSAGRERQLPASMEFVETSRPLGERLPDLSDQLFLFVIPRLPAGG